MSLQPLAPALPAVAARDEEPADPTQFIRRCLAAVLRYKWMVLLLMVLGTAGGVMLARMFVSYEAQGTIWISQETPERRSAGPIRGAGLLPSTSWPDLLRSYAVLDRVTRELRLFVRADKPAQQGVFATLEATDYVRPGHYILQLQPSGNAWTLLLERDGKGHPVEQGTVGDSVGRSIGVRWQPVAEALRRAGDVAFTLTTPRQASLSLRSRLRTELPRDGNLLRAYLVGTNPGLTARALNEVMSTFVGTATDLKRRNLTEVTRTLERQLTYAGAELRDAEIALENFRVQTITLPTEGTPVSGGIEATRDPVLTNFFNQKMSYEDLAHERAALERTLDDVRAGRLGVDALWPVLPANDGGQELRAALTEYTAKDAALRTALQIYTDEHHTVRELRTALAKLRQETIPALAQTLVTQERAREVALGDRIASASHNLQEIPTRTIEEVRLRRNVEVRANLYTMLRNRYEEARLAETSSIPDVSVLDPAVVPDAPVADRMRQIVLLAVAGSLVMAVLLALLLDRIDRRVRYLDQVTGDLGLRILCAVPPLKTRKDKPDALRAAQVVEAFRSLRINVAYAVQRPRPIALTITSAGPGEGKSLVSANLALSFAEGGYRTVLIDADVRRGSLHSAFEVDRRPGLTDLLGGNVELAEATRASTHARLTLLPTGSRTRHGPELLASAAFGELLEELSGLYDVILIDSPPLSAGMDPYALGTATGSMLMVVRMGHTDRKLAQVKLDLLSRFPVHVLGAVVNSLSTSGALSHDYAYSYYGPYVEESDEVTQQEEAEVAQIG